MRSILSFPTALFHSALALFFSKSSNWKREKAGQELAPASAVFSVRRTGCCGVFGPVPRPLWIKMRRIMIAEVYSYAQRQSRGRKSGSHFVERRPMTSFQTLLLRNSRGFNTFRLSNGFVRRGGRKLLPPSSWIIFRLVKRLFRCRPLCRSFALFDFPIPSPDSLRGAIGQIDATLYTPIVSVSQMASFGAVVFEGFQSFKRIPSFYLTLNDCGEHLPNLAGSCAKERG